MLVSIQLCMDANHQLGIKHYSAKQELQRFRCIFGFTVQKKKKNKRAAFQRKMKFKKQQRL